MVFNIKLKLYFCCFFVIIKNIFLLALPSITSTLTSIISVKEGDKFSLECAAEAKPLPYLKWVKDGINSTLIGALQIIKYEVSSAQKSHAGRYMCIATNVAGSFNRTTDVIVMCMFLFCHD